GLVERWQGGEQRRGDAPALAGPRRRLAREEDFDLQAIAALLHRLELVEPEQIFGVAIAPVELDAATLGARRQLLEHGQDRRDADAGDAEDDVARVLQIEDEEAHGTGQAHAIARLQSLEIFAAGAALDQFQDERDRGAAR